MSLTSMSYKPYILFASLVLSKLAHASEANQVLDYSLIGTWIGAVAGVIGVAWAIYVYFKSDKSSVKNNNTIEATNHGDGDVKVNAKQKITKKSNF